MQLILELDEVWKPVFSYTNIYQISSYGRIKKKERFVRIGIQNGYCRINLLNEFNLVHRLMAKVFLPNPENKKVVNHKNGIKTDNRLSNLEWCTHSENMKHAIRTGLKKPLTGECTNTNILTEAQVREILKNGEYDYHAVIAKKYGVYRTTIGSIFRNESWKHIKREKKWYTKNSE